MNNSKEEENNTEILANEPRTLQEQRGSILAIAYEGPLPPAQELIRYNEAHPDAAHRIITMAEKQEFHRQKLETFGLVFGFIIVIMVTGAGTIRRALRLYEVHAEASHVPLPRGHCRCHP